MRTAVVARLAVAVIALLTAGGIGLALHSSSRGDASHGLAGTMTLARRSAPADGNLAVSVPQHPRRGEFRQLCETVLYPSRLGKQLPSDPNRIEWLASATGGTHASALAWCRQYLVLRIRRHVVQSGPSDNPGVISASESSARYADWPPASFILTQPSERAIRKGSLPLNP